MIQDLENQMNETTDFQTIQSLTSQRDEASLQLEEESERWIELLEKESA